MPLTRLHFQFRRSGPHRGTVHQHLRACRPAAQADGRPVGRQFDGILLPLTLARDIQLQHLRQKPFGDELHPMPPRLHVHIDQRRRTDGFAVYLHIRGHIGFGGERNDARKLDQFEFHRLCGRLANVDNTIQNMVAGPLRDHAMGTGAQQVPVADAKLEHGTGQIDCFGLRNRHQLNGLCSEGEPAEQEQHAEGRPHNNPGTARPGAGVTCRLAHPGPKRDGFDRNLIGVAHFSGQFLQIRRRGVATGELTLDGQIEPVALQAAANSRGIQGNRLTVLQPAGPGNQFALHPQSAGFPARLHKIGAVQHPDLQGTRNSMQPNVALRPSADEQWQLGGRKPAQFPAHPCGQYRALEFRHWIRSTHSTRMGSSRWPGSTVNVLRTSRYPARLPTAVYCPGRSSTSLTRNCPRRPTR